MINKFSNYLNSCHDTRAGVVSEMIIKSFLRDQVIKQLTLLLLIGFAFWSCEDAEELEPTGTVNITISTPGYVYLDDWWDYASKYEIYINN